MFNTLIKSKQLASHLEDPNWVVFDCRFTLTDTESGRNDYKQGHIPGAVYAHLDEDLSGEITGTSGRHPLPDVAKFTDYLSRSGVDSTKQVVVYDDAFGSIAGRLWWLLRWLGHENVALLEGGLPVWLREGLELNSEIPLAQSTIFTPEMNNGILADADDILALMSDANVLDDRVMLLDARAERRFTGEEEPLDKVAGHVPGAVNKPYDDNLDVCGEFETDEELVDLYEEILHDVKPENVIHMCGSGVTACHNMIAMEHVGLTGSKLYIGSWSDWISDPARPVATGEE